MAKFAQGRFALSISDRSGQAFPYLEMLKEWNGSFVHKSTPNDQNQSNLIPKSTPNQPNQ